MEPRFLLRFVMLFAAVFAVLFMAVWFYLSVTQPADAAEPPTPSAAQAQAVAFAREDVTLRTPDGGAHAVRVEVARTPEQQRVGLMYRDHLARNAGMLFVYAPPRPVAMWMKNTRIPLDMLFARADGTLYHVHENARPHDESLIYPPGGRNETAYVLELPAGTAKRLGLVPGTRLIRP